MAGETTSTTPEALAKELDGDDIFAQAFAQISDADAKLNATPGPSATATDKPTPAPTPTAAEGGTPAVLESVEDEGLPPTEAELAARAAEAAAKAAPTQTTPTQTTPTPPAMGDDEIARRIAAMVRNTQPEPPREPEPQRPAEPQPMFSREDMEFLNNYDTEYPDISRAETLRRRADLIQATQYIFGQITNSLRPIVDQVQLLASRTHLGDIQSQVPDYAQTREGVIKWVDEQPAYLKVAYQHVVQQGTAEEVADLIRRFKAETGAQSVAPPAQQTQNAPRTNPGVTQIPPQVATPDPAAQRAIAKLAPVQTKRAATTATATSKDDFEGAFAEFAKLLG